MAFRINFVEIAVILYSRKHRYYGDRLAGIHWCQQCACAARAHFIFNIAGFAGCLLFYPSLKCRYYARSHIFEDNCGAVAHIADSGELNGEPTDDQNRQGEEEYCIAIYHPPLPQPIPCLTLSNICMLIGFTIILPVVERIVQPVVQRVVQFETSAVWPSLAKAQAA